MAKKAKAKPKSSKSRQSPAAAKPIHEIRFPGESAKYRSARNSLLKDEMALRAQIEAVSAKRRELPLGGEIPEDYVFDEVAANGDVRQVRMSELFTPGKETLIIYSYMFGPKMATPCVSCTSILDGLDGQSEHVNQRVNFVVVAKSPIAGSWHWPASADGTVCDCCHRLAILTTAIITARIDARISCPRSTCSSGVTAASIISTRPSCSSCPPRADRTAGTST